MSSLIFIDEETEAKRVTQLERGDALRSESSVQALLTLLQLPLFWLTSVETAPSHLSPS